MLPDAPRSRVGGGGDHDDHLKIHATDYYDRPNRGNKSRLNEYVEEPSGGPDSGLFRSYSQLSIHDQSEEEEPHRHDLHDNHHHRLDPSPERSASVSANYRAPPFDFRDRLEFAVAAVKNSSSSTPSSSFSTSTSSSKRGPSASISSSLRRSDGGDQQHRMANFVVGFTKGSGGGQQQPQQRSWRRRDESQSSGMSTLSTVTTDSSISRNNVSIPGEDEDGYVVRSCHVDLPEESSPRTWYSSTSPRGPATESYSFPCGKTRIPS